VDLRFHIHFRLPTSHKQSSTGGANSPNGRRQYKHGVRQVAAVVSRLNFRKDMVVWTADEAEEVFHRFAYPVTTRRIVV
jgi:hypothetical protein